MRVSRLAYGECGGELGEVRFSLRRVPCLLRVGTVLCCTFVHTVVACLHMYTWDCVPRVSSGMPWVRPESRNPISKFRRLEGLMTRKKAAFPQPCPH